VIDEPLGDPGDVDSGHVEGGVDGVGHRRLNLSADARRYRAHMAIDVTDATFQTDVIDRSHNVAVVVDLWAPWCGPCKTIGPILERVTDATGGEVILAKVNVDENPGVSQAFQVQSIPAVYALRDGQVVDGFVGAYPEHVIEEFVANLRPSEAQRTVASLLEEGTEGAFRAVLELEPGNEDAIVGLAELLVARGESEQALAFLARIPESDRTRKVAAAARVSQQPEPPSDDHDATLTGLLDLVKTDDDARQRFVDILELMGPDDPRTAVYRKRLTARLF
jgi:putative thioredoxin